MLSDEKKTADAIKLTDVGSFGLINDPGANITEFLASNNLYVDDIDLVLYSGRGVELATFFGQEKLIDYQKLTGTFYTSSALALHYGIDILLSQPVKGKHIKRVLVCNNLIEENLGLILFDNLN